MRPFSVRVTLAALSLSYTLAADPRCSSGIAQHDPPRVGDACCAKGCGRCSGSGCGSLPGGSHSCCASPIVTDNASCTTHDAPCVVTDLGPSPAPSPSPNVATVQVSLGSAIASVAPEYVSFTIDTSQIDHSSFPWHSSTIDVLASALSPAHLRVGGTQGDYEVYAIGDASSQTCENLPEPMTDYRCYVLSQTMWENILNFSTRNKVSLVFGLNNMFGRPTKTKPEKKLCSDSGGCPARNQTNLEALLKWTAQNHPDAPIYAFELGNELNSCLNGNAGAKTSAEDFKALAKLRDQYWPSGQKIKLIGPDTHSAAEFSSDGLAWWKTFVDNAEGTLDAYTFHMYSMGNGPKLDPKNLAFLDPAALEKSHEGADALMNVLKEAKASGDLWGGEVSSANDGGQSGITDTYINGFWYLDQLGSSAAVGVKVFERQTLMSGSGYPIINQTTMTPLPDYWTALLHKRLMGQVVLGATSDDSMLRVYAHCSLGTQLGITLSLLNLADHSVNVKLGGDLASAVKRIEWILQAGAPIKDAANTLMSRDVLLNGKKLELMPGPKIPALAGRTASTSDELVMPATSYGFVQLPDVQAGACGGKQLLV